MKMIGSIISGIVWTILVLFLYHLPLGVQGIDWRLPVLAGLSWAAGLAFIGSIALNRNRGPARLIIRTIDDSTGLANRRAFQGLVEPLLKAAVRFSEVGLVVILNINNLDKVIETEGDGAAEEIVFHVAQAFLDSLRGSDILARYDKDELVAFLPKASSEFSQTVTERIMGNVAVQYGKMETPRDLNVSIGYSEFDPLAPQSLDFLIRQAYKEMIKSMGEAAAGLENASQVET